MEHASKEKKPVLDEYKSRIKKLESLGKDAEKEAKKHEEKLKKLGVKDAAAHCKSLAKSRSESSHSETSHSETSHSGSVHES